MARLKFVTYKRKREGRTNYKKRLKMLVSGIPRIVVRKSNKHIIVQVVNYADIGDKVLVTAKSTELKSFGWEHATGNLPAAYLTGLIAGKKALGKNVKKGIVDLGLQVPTAGTRLYAAVKGMIDAGVEVPCGDSAIPSEDRLMGKHIATNKISKFKKSPATMENDFGDVKNKILKK